MTATTNELTASRRGLVAALRDSISRNEFFAGLYILGCANGLLGRILLSFNSDGWMGILGGDISVIVWFACFAGVSMMAQEDKEEIRFADLAVAAVFLILVILPIFSLSWVAVTGLSLYILLFANGSPARKRGAVILREGQGGGSLYMLTSGRVRAFKKGADGKQNPLGDLKEGAFFGEMSILTGQPRMASVVALARCELLELDRPTLDGITKTHPHVWDVLREFAEKRRAAAQR